MTAIQQYLHVDNEVYLVSSIYPVIQGGEGVTPTAFLLNVYSPIEPYGVDSIGGSATLQAVQVVSVVKAHDQPYSGDAMSSSVILSGMSTQNVVRTLDQPYSGDAVGSTTTLLSAAVLAVVKSYSISDADAAENSISVGTTLTGVTKS